MSHIVAEKGVYFRREGYILRASLYINGGIFWEGGVDSGIVTFSCEKWEVGLYCMYCGREEYILGWSHIYA